jgi:hypothetical protein
MIAAEWRRIGQNGTVSLCCPRCGGEVRPPDLMHGEWRCDMCGPVAPLHVASLISAEVLAVTAGQVRHDELPPPTEPPMPMWCLWPLLPGWTVTGFAWAGDPRARPRATAVALSGPAPLSDGPADLVFVAEEPGIGLGPSLAGLTGPDPGPPLEAAVTASAAHAKVRAGGHPTPLWAVESGPDCTAYAGEARGLWLYAITWPATAGHLLAEPIVLHDLAESVPSELVFGAPSQRLHPQRVTDR